MPQIKVLFIFFSVCWNSYTTKHFFVIHTTLSGSSSFRAFLLESVLAKNEKAADKLFDFVRATFDLTLSFILKISKKTSLPQRTNEIGRLLLLTLCILLNIHKVSSAFWLYQVGVQIHNCIVFEYCLFNILICQVSLISQWILI